MGGKPIQLQNECTATAPARCPVLRKTCVAYHPNNVVYKNWNDTCHTQMNPWQLRMTCLHLPNSRSCYRQACRCILGRDTCSWPKHQHADGNEHEMRTVHRAYLCEQFSGRLTTALAEDSLAPWNLTISSKWCTCATPNMMGVRKTVCFLLKACI